MIRDRDFVEALEKGLQIISTFEAAGSKLTLSEVAERVGVSRAAARRYLLTLTELGYAFHDGRRFTLTPKVLILGRVHLGTNPVFRIVQVALDKMVEKTRESASAAVLTGSEILFVARAQSPRPFSLNVTIGTQLPAFRTAMGKVLLSGLHVTLIRSLVSEWNTTIRDRRAKIDPNRFVDEVQGVKAEGFATSIGELETGLNTIAVPLHHSLSRDALSIGVSVPESRMSRKAMIRELLPELHAAVTQVLVVHQ
jgi:IclR family transcriptional regulator, pca regulon regulatory protein